MTQGYEHNTEDEANQEPVKVDPAERQVVYTYHLSTVPDTWKWLWKDTLSRVVPLTAAGLIYAWLSRDGRIRSRLGVSGWLREIALGTALGIPLAAISAVFRGWVAPGYRLPTPADQAVQSTFYLAINAPAEELFWRGTVQSLGMRLLRSVLPLGPVASVLGWAIATLGYGGYHRLGGWSWRSIAGVTAAGALFGWLYHVRPRDRALIAPVIVHGFATAGFLSWGDTFLHRRTVRRLTKRYGGTPHPA
jgi:hypothetical protein